MLHVILLHTPGETAAPELLDALREAGVSAAVASTAPSGGVRAGIDLPADDGVGRQPPAAIICQIGDGVSLSELHEPLQRMAEIWPVAPVIACLRTTMPDGDIAHPLDEQALLRIGFHAVANDAAQLPALLRDIEVHHDARPTGETTQALVERVAPATAPPLPTRVDVSHLRAAFELAAALHFVSDQQGAAQAALVGLAPLVRADRWVLYLVDERGGAQPDGASFDPLAARGSLRTGSSPALAADDWRRALTGDALLSLAGAESAAARAALTRIETVCREEGGQHVLAVPLVCGERVLGVVEAARGAGDGEASFSPFDAEFLSALAGTIAAALANSARIAEAERLSLTDDLTKLHNARFLRQYLTAEIKRARRYNTTVSALFIDLDNFKAINDRHGHLVGSHVLMEMATVILTGVRDTDIVARYGGDEFVVILPETGSGMAGRVAERVREKIAVHAFTGGRALRLKLTASFGVASFPRHSQSPQQLLADADAAMYEAKAARKNCVRSAGEHGPAQPAA